MDHEVVPRTCKICGWLLNSSQDYFGLHQGKNVRATMEFEVSERHVLRFTLSTDMVGEPIVGKGKGPWQRNVVIMIFFFKFWGKRSWRQEKTRLRMVKHYFILFPKLHFFGHISKNKHIHFLVHGHFSWSTFDLHLVGGAKGFVH